MPLSRIRQLSSASRLRGLSLAALLAASGACAQGTGLGVATDGDLSGGFPTSATEAPTLVPDRNAPPSITAAPSDADEIVPAANRQNQPDPNDPNYARARLRASKLYSPNLKSNPPLSSLVPYRTSLRPLRGAAAVAAARSQLRAPVSPNARPNPAPNPAPPPRELLYPLLPGPAFAAIPFPVRNSPPALAEADAFAPSGVSIGDVRLLPFVEGSTGFQTNPNQVQTGVRSSAEFRIDAGTAIASDFSNNALTGNVRGGYSLFPSNSNANRPDVSAVLDGRIDVTRDTKINTEARLVIVTQTPGSPLLAVPNSVFITSRPLITSEGATLGASHQFNRLNLDVRGTFDRTQYGDATQSDGSIFRYSQDNYDDYGLVARASYELTPGIIPFAETGVDARVRDSDVDLSGYRRDSRGILGRAGSSFEFFGHFTGTLSAGYAYRHYDDPRLPELAGPTVDGALVYAFSPLTTVTLRANTTLSETTLAGASGAISRLVSLEIAHVLFRHFTVSGIATYQPNQYQGVAVQEAYTQFTLKGAYSFSREVQLIASASQQNLQSSLAFNGFKDTIFLLGVRMQR